MIPSPAQKQAAVDVRQTLWFVRVRGACEILSCADALERGTTVVARTDHGLVLGEVLGPVAWSTSERAAAGTIERVADAADLEAAARREREQAARFEEVAAIFDDGRWPIRLLDVECLLDGRLVLQYLGPRGLDTAGLRERLRARLSADVVFEPVGGGEEPDAGAASTCGTGCGAGGCGEGSSGGGCGTSAGCSTCGVKELARGRRPRG